MAAPVVLGSRNLGQSPAQMLTTGSFTPTAGALLVMVAECERADHTTGFAWSVTGGGLTWAQVAASPTTSWVGNAFYANRMEVWAAVAGDTPSPMTVTVDPFTGTQQATGSMHVVEFPPGSTIEAVGIDADDVGQSASNQLQVTLPGAPTVGNTILAAFGQSVDVAAQMLPPSGYSALVDEDDTYVNVSLAWTDADGATPADATSTSHAATNLIGVICGTLIEVHSLAPDPPMPPDPHDDGRSMMRIARKFSAVCCR